MPDKKIIAVMGATGAQGGGLARAIAADRNGPFVARAITRKVDSDKAQALARLGVVAVTRRTTCSARMINAGPADSKPMSILDAPSRAT